MSDWILPLIVGFVLDESGAYTPSPDQLYRSTPDDNEASFHPGACRYSLYCHCSSISRIHSYTSMS